MRPVFIIIHCLFVKRKDIRSLNADCHKKVKILKNTHFFLFVELYTEFRLGFKKKHEYDGQK